MAVSLLEYINSEERGYILPFMGTNGLFMTGYSIEDVNRSSKKQLHIAKLMEEKFESDFVYAHDYGSIFCESLGMNMLRPDKDFPSVLEHFGEEQARSLKPVYPEEDEKMKAHLESIRLISGSFEKPFFISIPGPFTTAVQIFGATEISRKMIRDEGFVYMLIEYATGMVKRYAAAVEGAGAKFISISEPFSVILSPKRFEKYVTPALDEVYASLGCWKGLHICGDTSKFIDMMVDASPDCISFDQIMDLESLARSVPKQIVIAGNIDPVNVLGRLEPEQVKRETLRLVKSMRGHSNFLAAFGCTCLNDTPEDNLKAVLNAARLSNNDIDAACV